VSQNPLVSICIPTFNGIRFVEKTLQSVVGQTYKNIEILISDHSSSDYTIDVISEFKDSRIKVSVLPSGGGAAANWNASIREGRGAYLKLLCQDDVLKPTCIEEQVNALESNKESSFCFSSRDIISPKGRTLLKSRGYKSKDSCLSIDHHLSSLVRSGTNIFGEPCCVLMRTSKLRQVAPFSGSYLIDLNMWISLWEIGTAIQIPKSLAQFRISEGSWTSALDGHQTEQIKVKFRELKNKYPQIITDSDFEKGVEIATKLEKSRRRITHLVESLRI
jgi:glycosyltransferase involved in cell wall biosynthesis